VSEEKNIDPNLLRRMMMGEFSASGDSSQPKKPKKSKGKKLEKDLHFDKLYPQSGHLDATEKLNLQLEEVKSFVIECQKSNAKHGYLIVGKGEGVLKSSVLKLLAEMELKATLVVDPPYFGNAVKLAF
jgi:hypothetical protein